MHDLRVTRSLNLHPMLTGIMVFHGGVGVKQGKPSHYIMHSML